MLPHSPKSLTMRVLHPLTQNIWSQPNIFSHQSL
uniref:Uncharacterized protein n=1 Tax=Anguilla anguilla TaxID=7936 RepID=A0A0E9S547_ANGAN